MAKKEQKKITIRRAAAEDIDSVLSMWVKLMGMHRLFGDTYTCRKDAAKVMKKHLKTLPKKRNTLLLVAEVDRKLCGYAIAEISRRPPIYKERKELIISDIFIKKSMREQGVGKKLMEAVLDWTSKKGIKLISLQVDAKNKDAIKFYSECGFTTYRHVMTWRCWR